MKLVNILNQLIETSPEFQTIMDLRDKWKGKWLNATLTEVSESVYGKGHDILVMLDLKKHKDSGLPVMIESAAIKGADKLKTGDKVKVQLYISAGGILVDKIKKG